MSTSDTFIDVTREFGDLDLDDESRMYLAFHSVRYRVLVETVAGLVQDHDNVHVLDVGPSFQTPLLRRHAGIAVSTLGFADDRFPLVAPETHIPIDLNDAQFPDRWPDPKQFDGVVLAEVIEHLPTAPTLVLRMLRSLVRPGGWLLVQTPNAAALNNRLTMFAGKNPFEAIREDATNPGHFREYTLNELLALGPQSGMQVERWSAAEYFTVPGRGKLLYSGLVSRLPPRFRAGFTVVYRRPMR